MMGIALSLRESSGNFGFLGAGISLTLIDRAGSRVFFFW